MVEVSARLGFVVDTEHGQPAVGGLLDVFWNDRRAEEFDEGCQRG